MRDRWPRWTLAVLVVAGSAALGAGALGAAAGAVDAVAPCNLHCSPPSGSVTSVPPADQPNPGDIAVTTTWSVPADGHIDVGADPNSVPITITMSGPAGLPTGAPTTTQASPVTLTPTCSPPSGGVEVCTAAWPLGLEREGYALNGQYQISAQARTCPNIHVIGLLNGCSTIAQSSASEAVTNQATPPGNVKATLSADKQSVTVTWSASPEPDVFGYEVSRINGNTASHVAFCESTFAPANFNPAPLCSPLSVTDSASGGGTFTYQVIAYRFGGGDPNDRTRWVPSDGSKAQSGSPVVVVGPVVPGGGTGTVRGPGGVVVAVPTFGVFSAKPPAAAANKGGTTAGGGFNSKPTESPALGGTPNTVDPGFEATLPYQKGPGSGTTLDPAVIGGSSSPEAKGHPNIGSIALVGAGLLVSVVAMHGLWLRSEVKRSGVLEVLEPEH